MKILALEFSSPQRSVAVVHPGGTHEALSDHNDPFTLIEEVLRAASLEREQIEVIAIGLGPGSYTGIRSAISLAQGWQLARPIQILGISSADCVAAQAKAEGATGRLHVLVDAQRGEFYLAAYDLAPGGLREIEPLRIVTADAVKQRVDAGEAVVGPEVSRWFPAGKTVFPRAAMLGQMALTRTDFVSGEQITPIYLRETQFVKAPPPRVIS